MQQKQRDLSLDIFRGLGIFFVILGHIHQTPLLIRLWICTFHMPLFFICSGMLYSIEKYNGFLPFLKKKIQTLVIPYFCLITCLWILVNLRSFILNHIGMSGKYLFDFRHVLLSILLSNRLHTYYFSLWFVCALFLSELVFYPIVRFCGNKKHFMIIIAIGANFLQFLLSHYVKGGVWSFDLIPTCISFMSIGYLAKSKKITDELTKPYFFPICLSINIIFAILNTKALNGGYTALFYGTLGNPFYYFFAALTGSWAIFVVSKNIERLIVAEFLGKNSLIIYAFQNSFAIPVANDIFCFFKSKYDIFNDKVLEWIFIVIITLFISSLLAYLITRFTPWMTGHPRKKHKNDSST